jgi:signal transduction histidine kinase
MTSIELRPLLRDGLLTALFCCAIALALTVGGNGPWDVQLVYSLAIGLVSWLVIDLGRMLLTGADCTGWPQGWRGPALIAAGTLAGFGLGSLVGDAYSGASQPLWHDRSGPATLVITVIAGIAISFFFYSRAKAEHLQRHMAQAQHEATQARLKLLEAQLEPHMLFNTLANLRVLIATDPERAQHMLDRLIGYLRATLAASRSTLHPLSLEFERLQDYLELMAVRMGPRLVYALEVPEALHAIPVPPLLLQPLVENAIRHGLEPQVEGGRITVRACTDANRRLVLEVCDTGAGLAAGAPAAPSAAGRSFGLAQVRERLSTLYGDQGTIELIAQPAGGTCARVQFPLEKSTP